MMIILPSTSCTSLWLCAPAKVWKDALQRPVERSQTLTTPAESSEIAMVVPVCNLIDMIEAEESDTSSESEAPICQNLIDLSDDDEIREEENTREVM